MTKNDKQQDLFARQRKGNQTKEILTSIDIGSDKIICLIAKSDQVTREKRAINISFGVNEFYVSYLSAIVIDVSTIAFDNNKMMKC